MEDGFAEALRQAARSGVSPAGQSYRFLALGDTVALAGRFGLLRRDVEIAALEAGIIPERYQRSIGTVGLPGQIRLLKARVGVVGAGGLGGLAVELLARMGVGSLVVIDGDDFTDSNLNRQLLAAETDLLTGKAGAAARRVAEINGSVTVSAVSSRGDAANLPAFLEGCSLALDCLDNLTSRFDLEEACQRLGIPLVHGAVAGFMGQIAVIRPGRPLFSYIYGPMKAENIDRGAETSLGNPAATPAMIAAWQVGEAVKILIGLDEQPGDRLFIFDMLTAQMVAVELPAD
jgi:molybdopterin/thiamine biosynthesis adenylyltransferase